MPSRISFIADKTLFKAENTVFVSSTGTDLGVFNSTGIRAESITAGTLQASLIASNTLTSLGQYTLHDLNPDITLSSIESEFVLTSPSVTSVGSGYVLLSSSNILSWSISNPDAYTRRFYLLITAKKSENNGAYTNLASFYIDSQEITGGGSGLRSNISIAKVFFLDPTPVSGSTTYRVVLSLPSSESYHSHISYFQSSVLTISKSYY